MEVREFLKIALLGLFFLSIAFLVAAVPFSLGMFRSSRRRRELREKAIREGRMKSSWNAWKVWVLAGCAVAAAGLLMFGPAHVGGHVLHYVVYALVVVGVLLAGLFSESPKKGVLCLLAAAVPVGLTVVVARFFGPLTAGLFFMGLLGLLWLGFALRAARRERTDAQWSAWRKNRRKNRKAPGEKTRKRLGPDDPSFEHARADRLLAPARRARAPSMVYRPPE